MEEVEVTTLTTCEDESADKMCFGRRHWRAATDAWAMQSVGRAMSSVIFMGVIKRRKEWISGRRSNTRGFIWETGGGRGVFRDQGMGLGGNSTECCLLMSRV